MIDWETEEGVKETILAEGVDAEEKLDDMAERCDEQATAFETVGRITKISFSVMVPQIAAVGKGLQVFGEVQSHACTLLSNIATIKYVLGKSQRFLKNYCNVDIKVSF